MHLLWCCSTSFFFLFLSLGHISGISRLAVLPVYTENINTSKIIHGPQLRPKAEINDVEIGHVIANYLKFIVLDFIKPYRFTKFVYQRLGLTSRKPIHIDQLKQVASQLRVSRLLLSYIYENEKGYFYESSIYYVDSNQVATTIRTHHPNDIWLLMSEHLHKRFKSSIGKNNPLFPKYNNDNNMLSLFLLNASGSEYQEWMSWITLFKDLTSQHYGVCIFNNMGESVRILPSQKQLSVLTKIRVQGSLPYIDNGLGKGLQCIYQLANRGNPKCKQCYLTVGASNTIRFPKTKVLIKSYIRRLSRKFHILIVGSASLDKQSRHFWRDVAIENSSSKQALYRDILYYHKVGLSSLREVYLFKEGWDLYQSNKIPLERQQAIKYDTNSLPNFVLGKNNVILAFERLATENVIARSKLQILLNATVMPFLLDKQERDTNPMVNRFKRYSSVRIFGHIDGVPVWLTIPRDIVYHSNKRTKKITLHQSYYFLLDMQLPSKQAKLFINRHHFGHIFSSYKNVPKLLHLNIRDYISSPAKYIGHSIGNTSLYVFFIKVGKIID